MKSELRLNSDALSFLTRLNAEFCPPDQSVLEGEMYDGLSKDAKDAQLQHVAIYFQDTFKAHEIDPDKIDQNAEKILDTLDTWKYAKDLEEKTVASSQALAPMNLYTLRRVARINVGFFYLALQTPQRSEVFANNLQLWHHLFSASSRAIEMNDQRLRIG